MPDQPHHARARLRTDAEQAALDDPDLAARREAVLDRLKAGNDRARGITPPDGPEATR